MRAGLFLLLLLSAPGGWSCVRGLSLLDDRGITHEGRLDSPRHLEGSLATSDRAADRATDRQSCPGGDPSGAPFAGGEGSATNPFLICTAKQLGEVRNHLGASFRLEVDLDLAGVSLPPIGGCPPQAAFTGTFDGNGRTISNHAYKGTAPCVGLFGFLGGTAQITRLGLRGVEVAGPGNVGGLVGGYASPGVTVSRCFVEGGTVASTCGTDPTCGNIGALVGGIGEMKAGGAAGPVTDCWASANVSGPIDAGGLVGWLNGLVSHSYATGAVTMTMGDGWGIGGVIGGQYDGTVQSTFAAGPAAAQPVVGNPHGGKVLSSYASADPSVFHDAGHPVFTTSPAWDFVTVWRVVPGALPRLR